MKEQNIFHSFSLVKLVFLFLILSGLTFSQRSKIEGVITDAETGEPLFGANVVILNTLKVLQV